ncbi:hypothetical protein [Halomonas mongoliensis]|uniref:hypothetical protein n=1 Tax=Halomonas mongoliensis TaxID=321265 RepID=UPI00403ABAF9
MMRHLLTGLLTAGLVLLASPATAVSTAAVSTAASSGTASANGEAGLLDHELRRLHSSEVVDLQERLGGAPLLLVNTASRCGFTGQFEGLARVRHFQLDFGLKSALMAWEFRDLAISGRILCSDTFFSWHLARHGLTGLSW